MEHKTMSKADYAAVRRWIDSIAPMLPAPSRPRLTWAEWDQWAAATPDPAEEELERRFADRLLAMVGMDENLFGPKSSYLDDIRASLAEWRRRFQVARWHIGQLLIISGVETSPALARIGWRCSVHGAYVAPYAISDRSPPIDKPRSLHDDPYIQRLEKMGLYIQGTYAHLNVGAVSSPRFPGAFLHWVLI